MSLLSPLVGGVVGGVVWVAVGVVSIAGIGAGQAHAQDCDPVEAAKLLADDGSTEDLFGWAVSIDGDTAVVGAVYDDDNGTNSGAAYVYLRSGGVWSQHAKLLPADGQPGAEFGWSVAINGDIALIGAMGDDDNGTGSGSAYVFTRDGGNWTQQAKLLPSDGLTGDNFGNAVAVSGENAIIGAHYNDDYGSLSGAAYVFTRISGLWWLERAKLLPDDGARDDRFGWSVAISGETALVGAWQDDDNGEDSGSAYVFSGEGGTWTQRAKLLPGDGAEGDEFGYSVAVSGETALVGARYDDDNGPTSGSAYVFVNDGSSWQEQAKLLPLSGVSGDRFGASVSLSGETALIGAWNANDNGSNSGSAFVFTRILDLWWIEYAKLLPHDGAYGDYFGSAVSISGEAVLIGAWQNDDNGHASGSAYVFDLGCTDCPADLNGDGVVDAQDFLLFRDFWSAGDMLADWNGDGDINTLDFLAYLTDWVAGC